MRKCDFSRYSAENNRAQIENVILSMYLSQGFCINELLVSDEKMSFPLQYIKNKYETAPIEHGKMRERKLFSTELKVVPLSKFGHSTEW